MKYRASFIFVLLLVSNVGSVISCRHKGDTWQGTIEVVDGITIVRNPVNPLYGEDVFTIEEELTIGERYGSEERMFSQIIDVGVDDDENIYVLDFIEFHIKVFDKYGEYKTTIGKKGQGPGEIQRPVNLVITPEKEILINDRGARFFHYFKLNGEYLRSVRQTKLISLIRPKVDSQNNIVARIIVEDKEGAWSFVLGKFDFDLKKMFTIFTYEYELSPQTIHYFMADCFWEIFDDDSIIWGFSDKYEFEVLDKTGRTVRRIIKDYIPVEITKEEKEKHIKDSYGEKGIPPGLSVSWDRYHNAYRFMTIDDSGKIYVQTYEKTPDEGGYYYDVFDSEGKYIAKISLGSRPEILKKGKLYTVEEDEDGFQYVKRYKVVWKY
jgi:hypothetical protein